MESNNADSESQIESISSGTFRHQGSGKSRRSGGNRRQNVEPVSNDVEKRIESSIRRSKKENKEKEKHIQDQIKEQRKFQIDRGELKSKMRNEHKDQKKERDQKKEKKDARERESKTAPKQSKDQR